MESDTVQLLRDILQELQSLHKDLLAGTIAVTIVPAPDSPEQIAKDAAARAISNMRTMGLM